ncbi:hypothetical protein [Thalassotalea atypica]|uniref:hypothetical protein n=1 Tax=Thalassotalea atypica TaxID=2054316 RepID=UPI002572C686|nr:hypothetical protein [Thalassotalea atypica]
MSLFTLLREKEDEVDHQSYRINLLERVAKNFEPKEDITAYEMALVFKIFAMLSNDMDIEEIREKAKQLNSDRHFNFDDE